MRFLLITIFIFLFSFSPFYTQAQHAPPKGTTTCTITYDIAVEVLKAASPIFNCPLQQLVDEYLIGTCTIEFVDKDSVGYKFKVSAGGGGAIIILIDNL